MKLNINIAWRFLTYSKWQSVLIAFGIATGIAVQMFVGLLIDSLQENLIGSTLGSSAHITITSNSDGELIKNPEGVKKSISSVPSVTNVVIVSEGSGVVLGVDDTYPVLLRGLENNSDDLFGFQENLVKGQFVQNEREAVIGIELFDLLGIDLDETISISDGKGKQLSLKVVGVFEQGVGAADKGIVVANIRAVQNFFGLRNRATKISIQIDDVFNANTVALEIAQDLMDSNLEVESWEETNQQLLNALSSQGSSSLIIQVTVLISVAVAITSILSITVLQKQKQIGILKAMGFSNSDSSIVFILSSFGLGFLGSTLGLIMGFGMFWGFINNATNPNGSPIFEPIVRWQYVFVTWFVSLVISTAAGIVPARRSAELDPIDIIQNA